MSIQPLSDGQKHFVECPWFQMRRHLMFYESVWRMAGDGHLGTPTKKPSRCMQGRLFSCIISVNFYFTNLNRFSETSLTPRYGIHLNDLYPLLEVVDGGECACVCVEVDAMPLVNGRFILIVGPG